MSAALVSCDQGARRRACEFCRSVCVVPVCERASVGDEVPVRCLRCGGVTGGYVGDRLYATRFDRMPEEEPWRSQWLMVEHMHAAKMRAGDSLSLVDACRLADERSSLERAYQRHALAIALRDAGVRGRA